MSKKELETQIWVIDNKLKEVTSPEHSIELLTSKRHLESDLKTNNYE